MADAMVGPSADVLADVSVETKVLEMADLLGHWLVVRSAALTEIPSAELRAAS